MADRVRFHGFVPEDDLVAAYARASVFCMPGIAELQSLVTLEAMAAGNPVIAADAMALPHLVRPGRNGWLFQPGNVGELATHLTTLLGTRHYASRWAPRAVSWSASTTSRPPWTVTRTSTAT